MRAISLLGLVLFITLAESAWVRGSINTDRNWQFVAKFAFDAGFLGNNSAPALEIYAKGVNASNSIISYYMWSSLNGRLPWAEVYSKGSKWMSAAECNALVRQNSLGSVPLSEYFKQPFDEGYPRYWFIAISNCDSPNGIHGVDYSLHFTQGDTNWGYEVSYDQQDLPGLYLFYFLVFLIGLALHAYGVWSLYRSDFLHPVVKLLSATIFTYFLSIFCFFVHWMAFKNNGIGSSFMLGAGEFLDFVAQTLFILLLLLIAKGWAISTTEVSEKKILTGFIFVFAVLYLSLFIYAWKGLDPASTLYIYETAPGIVLLVIRALTLIYFIFCLRYGVLYESHPSKRRFYQIFVAVYTAWFLSLHIIVIVAAVRDPENRIRTVEPFYVTVNTLALTILGFLFWPSQIVKYFDVRPSEGLLTGAASSPYETL